MLKLVLIEKVNVIGIKAQFFCFARGLQVRIASQLPANIVEGVAGNAVRGDASQVFTPAVVVYDQVIIGESAPLTLLNRSARSWAFWSWEISLL